MQGKQQQQQRTWPQPARLTRQGEHSSMCSRVGHAQMQCHAQMPCEHPTCSDGPPMAQAKVGWATRPVVLGVCTCVWGAWGSVRCPFYVLLCCSRWGLLSCCLCLGPAGAVRPALVSPGPLCCLHLLPSFIHLACLVLLGTDSGLWHGQACFLWH